MTRWQQAWSKGVGAAALMCAAATQVLAAQPVLSIAATPDPAAVGSPLALDVLISGITGLYAFQFTLSFDPAVLQATGVSEGSFLAAGGSTFFDGGSIDNTAGTIAGSFDTLLGPGPGVDGSGVLAHISLDVMRTGTSALSFSDTLFLDAALNDVNVQIDNGVLQAVPEPATYALFGIGLAGLATGLGRRRRAA